MEFLSHIPKLFNGAGGDDDDGPPLDEAAIEAGLPEALRQAASVAPAEEAAEPEAEERRLLLAQSLRVAKLDVARATQVVRNLDAFRAGEGWRFPRLRAHDVDDAALRSRMHVLLPGPDRRGRPVLMYNARFLDPALPAGGGGIAAFQKMGSYLMEIATRVPSVQHGGVTLLLDLGGVDTRLAARFSAADLVRGVGMWKDCFPCKLKRVLVVRSNSALTALCHAGVALVRRKIRARVAVLEGGGRTGGFAALHEEIAPELLPPELGGTCDHSVYWARWCDARARLEGDDEVAAVAAAGQAGRREGDAAAPLGSEEGGEKATGAMTADMASVKLVVG